MIRTWDSSSFLQTSQLNRRGSHFPPLIGLQEKTSLKVVEHEKSLFFIMPLVQTSRKDFHFGHLGDKTTSCASRHLKMRNLGS